MRPSISSGALLSSLLWLLVTLQSAIITTAIAQTERDNPPHESVTSASVNANQQPVGVTSASSNGNLQRDSVTTSPEKEIQKPPSVTTAPVDHNQLRDTVTSAESDNQHPDSVTSASANRNQQRDKLTTSPENEIQKPPSVTTAPVDHNQQSDTVTSSPENENRQPENVSTSGPGNSDSNPIEPTTAQLTITTDYNLNEDITTGPPPVFYPCGKVTFVQKFNTSCNLCYVTRSYGCPQNAKFLREVPCFGSSYCMYECEMDLVYPQCCPGRWGSDCQVCPGSTGFRNASTQSPASQNASATNVEVCSGHGNCSEGLDGTGACSCNAGFSGFACEQCMPNMYGSNCNSTCHCVNGDCDAGIVGTGHCTCNIGYKGTFCDQVAKCNNSFCAEHATCVGKLGQQCACLNGYRGLNGVNCSMIDICEEGSSRCDANAICNMLGPAKYNCTCKEGYKGDGFACEPIDPCQDTDNPVCPLNSTSCKYTGPGRHTCKCLPGFANFTKGSGCAVRNLCTETEPCHKNANCTMLAPNRYRCRCVDGYVGNGKVCHGNILQSLQLLNARGQFRNRLTKAIQLFEFALGDALQTAKYFTVFVPVDSAFANVNFRALMSDWPAGSQTVKNHILPVARTLHRLVNGTIFYTLEGNQAEISVIKRKSQIKYRLARTTSGKAKVMRGNFPASNGIIHIINKMIDKPPVIMYKKRQTLLSQIQTDGRYNRLEGLLGFAGIQNMLNLTTKNYTLFTPNNKVWDSMGDGILEYLQTGDGKAKLVTLLKNHIVPWNYFSFDMLTKRRVRTLGNNMIDVTISPSGQIFLNGNVSITQTDIPASNGLYHHIDGVLVPESILPIMNRHCGSTRNEIVDGACSLCTEAPRCELSTDVPRSDPTRLCFFEIPSPPSPSGRPAPPMPPMRVAGCRPKCNRTIQEQECCKNFFGPSCDPCPGGPITPCNGRGTCNDGFMGNGSCTCHQNFTGTICDHCSDPKKHGPTCSQDCKCLHGECDNRVLSVTGFCKTGTCLGDYVGLFCHQTKQRCGIFQHKNCHANAYCSFFNQSRLMQMLLPGFDGGDAPYGTYANFHFKVLQLQSSSRCHCNDGYAGDGVEQCTPIDPCEQPSRGDCHKDAECTFKSPGQSTCKCNSGWVGDGFYCYPGTVCTHDIYCHPDAFCERSSPGEYHCVCRQHFHGNGTYCVPNNMCDYHNGGCSMLASCTPLGPGNRTCTCPAGYGGDGVTCIGSLWQEIDMIISLQEFRTLLTNTSLPQMLSDINSHYTIFAPNDSVLVEARSQGYSCISQKAGIEYYITPRRYTLHDLQALTHGSSGSMNAFLPTLALDASGKARELKITFPNQLSVNKAHMLPGNITALNGIIHIIDGCLSPHEPAGNITHLLIGVQRYSYFTAALQRTGLLTTIEGLDSFTLFVLDNIHWNTKLNGSELIKYLSYYIVPKRVPMDNLPAFLQVETILGIGPSSRLNITKRNGHVYINDFMMYDDRLKTPSGNVYHLSHPLNPNIHRCDAINSNGQIRQECCMGYYGFECLPCPGGAASPCNKHGRCSSGISGSGQCQCVTGYTSDACNTCDTGYLAKDTKCSVDPCTFCDKNAECVHQGNNTHCRCAPSYVGDGMKCAHVCSRDNGGCDPNAHCTSSAQTNHIVHCQCPIEFYGNGLNCTRIVNLFESVKTLVATQDFFKLASLEDSLEPLKTFSDTLKNAQNYTLLVPQNWAGNVSINETGVDITRHIVTEYFELVPGLFDSNYSYQAMSGDSLIMAYREDERTYTINGSLVLQRNIPATNGIVHIIDRPLRPPPITAPVTSENTFGTMGIVIGSLAAALILVILLVMLLLWKCRRHCHKYDGNQSGSGFKFLMLDDREDRCKDANISDAASTYQNPLYDTLESAGLTDDAIW